jgi:hypothetical protein
MYIKIDGKYYPFASPRLCLKCNSYPDMPDAVPAAEAWAHVDA